LFCAPGLVFGGTVGVGSRFHVLRARTQFCRYRGRRVPFSCFARRDSFSAITRALGPVFMFCEPGLIFGVTRALGPVFMFCEPGLIFGVTRVSGPVFLFCAPGLVFGVNEGVESRFHVLRALTHFRRYRGRRVPFECFGRLDSFSTVPRASGPVFMLCAPGRVFGGTEGVWCRFHVLRTRTHLRRYRGRRVLFLVLRARTRFRRYRGRRVLLSCYVPRTRCRR
jgi:hypothetical protein